MFSLLGKKEGQHFIHVISVGRRTNHQIDRRTVPDFHNADGCIIPWLFSIQMIALFQQDRAKGLSGITLIIHLLQKLDDVFPFPAKIK